MDGNYRDALIYASLATVNIIGVCKWYRLSYRVDVIGDKGVATFAGEGGSSSIPDKAKDIANQVKNKNGAAPKGYKGGKVYENMPKEGAQKLPEGIKYKEYDVNPYIKGQGRGVERIVIGDDGSVWYTNDHYFTFAQIEYK